MGFFSETHNKIGTFSPKNTYNNIKNAEMRPC